MEQTRWLTGAKAIADKLAVDGLICYIAETGEYTPWPDQEGYIVVSVIEAEELCKEWAAEDDSFPSDYVLDDWASDYCLYATDDSIEPSLEPSREEIEHYLDDYYTDHYQRDMPTGDYSFGVLFYCKVNPSWSGEVDDLIEQIKAKELEQNSGERYEYAVKQAIDKAVGVAYWDVLNCEYEYWSEQAKDYYHWIKDIGRVGRSGGHIKMTCSWPETIEELAEIAQDCATIDADIKAAIKWLESEEFWLAEYKARFGIEVKTAAIETVQIKSVPESVQVRV